MEPKWTKWALGNFDSIAAFISLDSPDRAKAFVLEIQRKTWKLGDFPLLWKPWRVVGTREFVVYARYVITYRVRRGNAEILRIQHAAMGDDRIVTNSEQ